MPKIRVNMDDLPDLGGGVSAGKHRAKLLECVQDVSNTSGEDMLVWNWEVIKTLSDTEDSTGATIKSYSTLKEDALGGLKMHLKAFGCVGEVDMDTRKLHGKTAILIARGHKFRDKDTGEEREGVSVASVLPDTGSSPITKTSTVIGSKKPVVSKASDDADEIPF